MVANTACAFIIAGVDLGCCAFLRRRRRRAGSARALSLFLISLAAFDVGPRHLRFRTRHRSGPIVRCFRTFDWLPIPAGCPRSRLSSFIIVGVALFGLKGATETCCVWLIGLCFLPLSSPRSPSLVISTASARCIQLRTIDTYGHIYGGDFLCPRSSPSKPRIPSMGSSTSWPVTLAGGLVARLAAP